MAFLEGQESRYPSLAAYTAPLKEMERPLVGREKEMRSLRAAMMRPELCNVILVADAGAGKTALVQGLMTNDKDRIYLSVDPAKMLSGLGDKNEMAARIKNLFDETAKYIREFGKEVILFIDEFHQIVQLSDAAVEALKPMLADSGTRGIRVIAATTYVEFRKWVAPNQPLVERLQRFNLKQPEKPVVIQILKGMAQKYKVSGQFYNDRLFEKIYDYTQRYIPSDSQPRKSILLMDSMLGWNKAFGIHIDEKLLSDVIYETQGIRTGISVDALSIKRQLDSRVIAQELATTTIEQRLQICVADLNNHDKPMSSFLFCGSTGVGKQLPDDVMVPVFTPDGRIASKRNGDLVVGDFVFDRQGNPTEVIGVFPQGVKRKYEVELTDGRVLPAGEHHLWTYRSRFGNGSLHWKVADTATLMTKMANKHYNKGRKQADIKFVIPMNGAVKWPEQAYEVHPYVIGVLLGNGCLTLAPLSVSSADAEVVDRCATLLGCAKYTRNRANCTWTFSDGTKFGDHDKCLQTADVLASVPEMAGKYANDKHIPDAYKHGSIEQRWELIRGLFDTDGHIEASTGRYTVTYSSSSRALVLDIQDVLFSLGIQSSVNDYGHRKNRPGASSEYVLTVKCNECDKPSFFSLSRKKRIAEEAERSDFKTTRKRVKTFGEVVGIRDIRVTSEDCPMTCIMVDNDEHLYQAGQYVVTHNTEVTKAMASILFNDEHNLIRFDMTEYALPESLERFRRELTSQVWARPYSVILLDEIEKAAAPVTRLLLQVLDDGRLIDENNREVTFKNSYVVLTTNAGSEIFENIAQYSPSNDGSGRELKKYMKLIRESIQKTTGDNRFPPELLGRIDCLVPFQPLSNETMKKIVTRKLLAMCKDVEKIHGIKATVKDDVVRYIVDENMDTVASSGGARAVVAKMESEVVMAVARYINTHPNVSGIRVAVGGQMAIDDKYKKDSDAYIDIVPVS